MWCFLRAGARKKHHMYFHTPEIPNEPLNSKGPPEVVRAALWNSNLSGQWPDEIIPGWTYLILLWCRPWPVCYPVRMVWVRFRPLRPYRLYAGGLRMESDGP
jgi:hypothetical protein